MSLVSKVKGAMQRHPAGHGYGLMANVATLVENAGAGYLAGYVENGFPGRTSIKGVPFSLWAGVSLKVLALGSTFTGVGRPLRSHIDSLGNGFVTSYFHTLGAGHGFKKSGRVHVVGPAAALAKYAAVPGTTVLGLDARAPQGDFLSSRDLASLARR